VPLRIFARAPRKGAVGLTSASMRLLGAPKARVASRLLLLPGEGIDPHGRLTQRGDV